VTRTHPSLLLLTTALALGLAGCGGPITAPEGEVDQRAIYQRVANSLPRADFGWGTPPAVVEMAASTKAEGELPPLQELTATERGFRVRFAVYRYGTVWIPYTAVESVSWSWKPLPNAFILPLLIVPLQGVRTTVVIDANQLPGLLSRLQSDIERMEGLSREVGLGGPWSFAQSVKAKLADDREQYGPGRISLHFDYLIPVPPWIPNAGPAEETGLAFAWCAANPEAPELPEEPVAEEPGAEEPGAENGPSPLRDDDQ
jgi:hypothetical protein